MACWLTGTPAAQAASFACGKAATDVEKTICDERYDYLPRIDEELAEAYRAALQQAINKDKDAIEAEQRRWLGQVRQCKTYDCLRIPYLIRFTRPQDGRGGLPLPVRSATPLTIDSFAVASQLFEQQFQQLKARLKKARDVSFPGEANLSMGGADFKIPRFYKGNHALLDYCKRIWQAVDTQAHNVIPEPEMFAGTTAEKQQLFDAVYHYATQNFNRYMAQKGHLSPNKVYGRCRG